MKKTLSGSLHAHTDGSILDSVMKVKDYVEAAKNMGATSIAITDHGTMLKVDDFVSECNRNGVKPIIGVELYVNEDESERKKHLVLLAKNYTGYKQISKIVTVSNTRIQGTKKRVPVANKEMLKKYGAGNNIICLTGCMQGVLADILLTNDHIISDIARLKKKQDKLASPNDADYDICLKKLKKAEEKVVELQAIKDELDSDAKLVWKAELKAAEKEKNKNAVIVAKKKKLAQEMANERLPEARERLKEAKKIVTQLNKIRETLEKKFAAYMEIEAAVNKLRQSMKTDEDLKNAVKSELEWLKSVFGNKNILMELQNHGIPEEKKVFPILAEIATETKTPVVATNDAHMVSREDYIARNIVTSISLDHYIDIRESDKELYLKSDQELADSLREILPDHIVKNAIHNISVVSANCNVAFEHQNHYPVFKNKNGDKTDAKKYLWEECQKGKAKLVANHEWSEEYETRMNYEFGVIDKMGFCDYLSIVQDFIKEAKKLAIIKEGATESTAVSVPVGPGRGSAVGSLVCYLTGITDVDPIRYGLLFERFLNIERVTMPDIDTDFSQEIREDVIEYVRTVYGQNAVCSITTVGTMAAKVAIRNAARVYRWKKEQEMTWANDDNKNAIKDKYLQLANSLCKEITDEKQWFQELSRKFISNKDAIDILNWAKKIEGISSQTSTHAAGVIISDNDDVSEHVPLMLDEESNLWKTQCDMVQAEEKGLLKMDFLGLKTLDIITKTLCMIKNNTGKIIKHETIPFESCVFEKIFQSGFTNGVFQFESPGMKNILKKTKPETIEDLIMLNAVYRPGPMDYIPEILDVKYGKKAPKYLIPGMKEILEPTYGAPVYQEQIMQLFQLAGFSLGEADIIRRYMSKKKTEKFMEYKHSSATHPGFVDEMVKRGVSKEDASLLWERLVNFSKYAFNKSHATVYAVLAYKTAWLKYHYPAEYIAAYLSVKPDSLTKLLQDAEIMGVKVMLPDVNIAEPEFITYNGNIVIGLKGLDGIGDDTPLDSIMSARKNAKFVGLKDFVLRTELNPKTIEIIVRAGGMDGFGLSRESMLEAIKSLSMLAKKIKEKKKAVVEGSEDSESSFKKLLTEYNDFPIPYKEKSIEFNLNQEKKIIGTFISGNPLDSFYFDGIKLSQIEGKNVKAFGLLSDIKKIVTKNKTDMAFARLSDATAEINVVIFPTDYAKLKSQLEENAVVVLSGNVSEEYDGFQDAVVKKLYVNGLEIPPKKNHKKIVVEIATENDQAEINKYLGKNRAELYIYYKAEKKLVKTHQSIDEKVLNNTNLRSRYL